MNKGYFKVQADRGIVSIPERLFFACAKKISEAAAQMLSRDGGSWISVAPGGDVLPTLIKKRTSDNILGRFPDGFYVATLTDLVNREDEECLDLIRRINTVLKEDIFTDLLTPQEPKASEEVKEEVDPAEETNSDSKV